MTMQNHRATVSTGHGTSFPPAARERHFVLFVPGQGRPDSHNHDKTERDDHDDGLVHGHFWAMSSTVR